MKISLHACQSKRCCCEVGMLRVALLKWANEGACRWMPVCCVSFRNLEVVSLVCLRVCLSMFSASALYRIELGLSNIPVGLEIAFSLSSLGPWVPLFPLPSLLVPLLGPLVPLFLLPPLGSLWSPLSLSSLVSLSKAIRRLSVLLLICSRTV